MTLMQQWKDEHELAAPSTGKGGSMTPLVSVVVPTFDRPLLLERLLRSLVAQDHPHFEIVVVDDHSPASTAEAFEGVRDEHRGVRMRLLRTASTSGPAVARNLGWRAADGALIAFIDDDCVATPSWLGALSGAASYSVIVQGRTTPDGDLLAAGPWAKSQNITRVNMRFQTCNLLVSRSILEQTGGFDERFGTGGGEDTDLGWRALEAGATVVFAEDAHALHVIWDRTFREHLRDRRRWAQTALLVKKHPGFREKLPLRFLYRPAHGVVLLGGPAAIVLIFTPLRWTVPVSALTWVLAYTALRGPRYGTVQAAQRSVETLVSAVWEVYLFARSSIRFRTLLL